MFGFFAEFSPLVRTLIALAIVGIGVYMTIDAKHQQKFTQSAARDGRIYESVSEAPNARYEFRGGVVMLGVGATLLCVSGSNRGERSGYRF